MFKNKRLLLVYLIVLVDVIAGSAIWPAFPAFVSGLEKPQIWLAIGTALFLGIQLSTAPLLGKLSDNVGRKPVFIISAIGTFFSLLLLSPIKAWSYFANRTADGFTNGVYAAVRSAVTDISDEKDIMENVGMEGTIVAVGFVIGPMLAGLLLSVTNATGEAATFSLICMGLIVSAINVVLCLFFKETLKNKTSLTSSEVLKQMREALDITQLWNKLLLKDKASPGLLKVVILQLFLTLSLGYYSYFITYLSFGALHLSVRDISYFFIYFGTLSIFTYYFFYTYIVNKIHHQSFIICMAVMGIATHVAYANTGTSLLAMYVIVTLDTITISLLPGVLDGLVAQFSEDEDRGELFGITQALNGVASLATTVVFGVVSVWSLEMPFYWFAICLVPLVVLRISKEKIKRSNTN
ncbi:MAG: MFS transporter [Cytophagales bacterium]